MNCLKNILLFQYLLFWQKKLFKTKNKNKNHNLVNIIKSRLTDLKIEKPGKILKFFKEILNLNNKIKKSHDMA